MKARTLICATSLSAALLLLGVGAGRAAAGAQTGTAPLNAFFVSALPHAAEHQEAFFTSLRQGGADTVMYAPADRFTLPVSEWLPDLVFAVHKARLKLYLVLPFRNLPSVLAAHPEWEDQRYDLGSGTIQPAGRIDLFNPAAVDYLASLFADIASYSVDGIFFGDDFSYGETEGMGPLAMREFEGRNGKALVVSRAISRTTTVDGSRRPAAYGEGYDEWQHLKEERLAGTLRTVIAAARGVNTSVVFGIPLHPQRLGSPQETDRRHGYDTAAFEAIPVDYYWIPLLHRSIGRTPQSWSYRRSMEELGRMAREAIASVRDPRRLIMVLQTMENGRRLPLTEIEEARTAAKSAGEAVLAYTISPEVRFPDQFTQKLFRR